MRAEALPRLLLDLSELVRHDARSGIQRVVRGVLRALLETPPAGRRVVPVYDAGGHYAEALHYLHGAPAGDDPPIQVRAGDIFLGLDLCPSQIPRNAAVLADLRRHGVLVHFIVYDLLPLRHPEWFPDGIVAEFGKWLETVTALADGLVCISRATADDLLDWLDLHPPRRALPLRVGYAHLGADIASSAPSQGIDGDDEALLERLEDRPTLLMVGTLEPRKMHEQALRAMELLWSDGVDVNLVIVGKPGWGLDALEACLRAHPEARRRLFWLERASDELLLRLYLRSSALLAPSMAEGFGLPLIEAAQHGLPVIARDLPVFREVGGEHAWYFTAEDGAQLAVALRDWLALRAAGQAPPSAAMPYLDWAASASAISDCLLAQRWYRTAPIKLP